MSRDVSPIRVLAAGMAWRMFGSQKSAQTLSGAMSGDDEQNRMRAGMSLVKAGQRSFDFIKQKIDAGEASPPLVRLLPDIDAHAARDVLIRIADAEQGELADTAKQCIESLDRINALESNRD